MNTANNSAKRPICTVCQRPQSACICQWVVPTEHTTEVLILQHPLEVRHAKNSAGLLHRSLPHSRLLVGEVFDAELLRTALAPPRHTLLLYPQTQPLHDTLLCDAATVRANVSVPLRLVVLDATWRKSRKMLHLSALLQGLPRLSLNDAPASHYVIRKAHKPGQLSTLEACCLALEQLEGDGKTFEPLLQAFRGFVMQQQAFVPRRDCA